MSVASISAILALTRRAPSRAGGEAGQGSPPCRSLCGSSWRPMMGASSRRSSCGCAMPAETPRAERMADGDAGSIALLALWSVVIIGFLLAAATLTIRTELRIAGNAIDESHARLAAEAGAQLGLARLIRRRGEGVLVFDGAPESWRDGGVGV